MIKKYFILVPLIVLLFTACKKDVDHPPVNKLSNDHIITLKEVIDMYQGEEVIVTDTISVYATVTMDEVEGNIYKNLYIQDQTGAINMRMTSSADLFVGDRVRVNLLGATINNYNGVMQLDNIDPDTKIVRQKQDQPLAPEFVSIADIDTNMVNQLVRLDGVQFADADLNKTYADAAGQSSQNIILQDCFGSSIILRTSGFANYAGDSVAKGNGSIIAIVDRYNDDLQLKIRSIKELDLSAERCSGVTLTPGASMFKNFDDNSITSGGWSVIQVEGIHTWEVSTAGGAPDPYLKISNYDGGNTACENWFISPLIKFTSGSNPVMSFDNDVNYSGPHLELFVSTEYTGSGDPNLVNWTNISGTVTWDSDGSNWGFENTGDIDLSDFSGQSVYFGFRYTGTNSNGSTWEIDEIIITG